MSTTTHAAPDSPSAPTPVRAEPVEAITPPHPARELLERYSAIFSAAWAMRHQLAGPKRMADELAFLPAALSLQDSPVHPSPRRLAYAVMALFAIALAWATLGQIDIVAVAQGRVVVGEGTKLIQSLEPGVVRSILVKDGSRVQAGQALVELDATYASADKTAVQEQQKAATSETLRTQAILKALLNTELLTDFSMALEANVPNKTQAKLSPAQATALQAQLAAEWADIRAKLGKLASEVTRRQAEIATVTEQVAKLSTTVPLAVKREQDFEKLADQGFVASHTGQDRTRERIELERDLATQQARLREAQATLAETHTTKAAYLAETRRQLADRLATAQLKTTQLTQDQAKASQRERLSTLVAPVAGTVQQLAIHSVGGVVTQAQPLMVIVPDEAQVTAEVTIDNKDIGYVSAGQEVSVKLETFAYTRYGTVPAKVSRVSADAVVDDKRAANGSGANNNAIFPATLTLGQSSINIDGKQVRLTPGMNLTAEIKTGQRRVIEYLLSPIQQAGSESLRER
jgi:hemolysin D